MKKKNFYITDKQIKGLERRAEETGLTVSEHLRRALDDYLREDKDGK